MTQALFPALCINNLNHLSTWSGVFSTMTSSEVGGGRDGSASRTMEPAAGLSPRHSEKTGTYSDEGIAPGSHGREVTELGIPPRPSGISLLAVTARYFPDIFISHNLSGGPCSVSKSCPTLCDSMDCSKTGFPAPSPAP